ncbi:DUF6292 family protein [Kutzneria viridogrisea]|uniref:DUF6292 domain-containing protein n=2 Tax=Kutzneria TaxID=43356 RepID=W5WII0_9PSEU|nr:DUF6292 family protein [Kutzneria albida]AHH97979.1 hypothetical protein KALB_4617 [Kutzneria albida DSM 43870]MBA8924364.1 hypothetical protein [Kutzneria viridogrisea]
MTIDPHSQSALGLGCYVAAVAEALQIPEHAVGFEVCELSSAYFALSVRSPNFPEHDLMLLWDERYGWSIGVETDPAALPVTLAYLGGDLLPDPESVREFVEDLVHSRYPGQPDPPRFTERATLPTRLTRYAVGVTRPPR